MNQLQRENRFQKEYAEEAYVRRELVPTEDEAVPPDVEAFFCRARSVQTSRQTNETCICHTCCPRASRDQRTQYVLYDRKQGSTRVDYCISVLETPP